MQNCSSSRINELIWGEKFNKYKFEMIQEKESNTEDFGKDNLSRKELMQQYGEYILSKGKRPVNVYMFTKELGIAETDFYAYFSNFEALEEEYLVYFFRESVNLVEKQEVYPELGPKEKLLNLYFVFFENLNMNRSLVLMILKADFLSKIQRLRPLKKEQATFLKTLELQDWNIMEKLPERLKESSNQSKEQLLWMHLLSVLKFWMEDRSPGFEKTDIYIEKSIDTGFDLIETPLMDKVFDFGKFLWQEKFQ